MEVMTRQELLTRYMVGRYRLGHKSIALYLAGTLFESTINGKLKEQDGWNDARLDQVSLLDKIDALSEETLKRDTLYKKKSLFSEVFNESSNRKGRTSIKGYLHTFRKLRNRIMHCQYAELGHVDDCKITNLINYLWCELAPTSFEKALSKRKDGACIIGTLYEHTADYMIRAIDEVEAVKKDAKAGHDLREAKILPKDFDNLFDLRRQLVPLKNYLTKWLPKHASFLQTDILSTIDTTSAYIWMPLVSKEACCPERRSGVYACSVSLLATPMDLRIYMDFGGYDRDQRKLYFDFLAGSSEYESIAEKLKHKTNFKVFDIDWYSFIFNQTQHLKWLNDRENALEKAFKKLEKTPNAENSPITWNRCLHGYVFSKCELDEEVGIDFEMIKQPLLDVVKFYEAFQNYKHRVEKKEIRD